MIMHAKNGTVQLDDDTMHYIRFGSGKKALVMLPGLGDGIITVKGTALPMAYLYRVFAKDYTVYIFSRRNHLPERFSTQDMARDLKEAMDALGIAKADVFGVSMGGMIAQHLAIDYPEKVGKLILTVTSSSPNPILTESIGEWVSCAKRDDHTALMDSNVRRIYSERYYRRNKWLVPIMGKLTKPKSYDRFFVQAEACLTHNAYHSLNQIQAPTLVIGGEKDISLGGDASREIAAAIPEAKLRMYEQWGHGVYEEAGDFSQVVLSFLMNNP